MEPLRGGKLASVVPAGVESLWKEAKVQRTPVEWALRWIWNRPEVTVILSGMNEEAHIRQNLLIASDARANAFSKEELDLVGRVGRRYRELMKVDCTGCGYCMPCPSDVMIPACFDEYNKLHMFGASDEVRFVYAMRMSGILADGRPGYASQCIQCGDCLGKCPQHIQVPDVLAQVTKALEGPDLAERVAIARKIFNTEAGA
jgi:predicted aldo/keto reductase-like oxidoreductase